MTNNIIAIDHLMESYLHNIPAPVKSKGKCMICDDFYAIKCQPFHMWIKSKLPLVAASGPL